MVWITLLRMDSTILSLDFHSKTMWSLIWLLEEWISTSEYCREYNIKKNGRGRAAVFHIQFELKKKKKKSHISLCLADLIIITMQSEIIIIIRVSLEPSILSPSRAQDSSMIYSQIHLSPNMPSLPKFDHPHPPQSLMRFDGFSYLNHKSCWES